MIDAKLKRVFWNWHFWAGLLVAPVLITLTVTGAIYIFKNELELWWYQDVAAAEVNLATLVLQPAVDDLAARFGDDYTLYGVELEANSGRAPAVLMMSQDGEYSIRRFFVDPDTSSVRGEIPKSNLFTITLAIHRRLMAGTPGRIVTELTTGWCITVTLLGIVLWWPRSWKSLRGVFVPRLSAKRYVWMRDLHSISGAAVSLLVIAIAVTGLLYSRVWGGGFQVVGLVSGQFDLLVAPPQSTSEDSLPTINIDQAVDRLLELGMPTERVTIRFPQTPTDCIVLEAGEAWGPSITRVAHLDRATGDVISDLGVGELPPMAIYAQWNYPLHVGSVGGTGTKVLWLIASIVLALLPIAGIAMWLIRRKPGTSGAPSHIDAIKPRWLITIMLLLGLCLPLVGLSIILVGIVTWIRSPRVPAAAAILWLFLSLDHSLCSADEPTDVDPSFRSEIESIVESGTVRGLSLALLEDEETKFLSLGEAALGTTDSPETYRMFPVSEETTFAGGSISKLITALTVLRLVEAGELSLQDSVAGHLKGVFDSPDGSQVTVAMLLEHTSGLPGSSYADYAESDPLVSPSDYVNQKSPFHLQWKPGKHFSYSNAGPVIAAAILEKVSGESFDVLVQRQVFSPIGMTASHFSDPEQPRPKSFQSDGQTLAATWWMPIRPSGALMTTASDLVRLASVLANDGLLPDGEVFLPEDRLRRMRLGETSMAARAGAKHGGYGLGSFRFALADKVFDGHYGKTEGFVATLGYRSWSKDGFVLLVNTNDGRSVARLRQAIADHLTRPDDPAFDQPQSFAQALQPDESIPEPSAAAGWYVGFGHQMPVRQWLASILESRKITPTDNGVLITPLLPTSPPLHYTHESGIYQSGSLPVATAVFVRDETASWWIDGSSFRKVSAAEIGLKAIALLLALPTAACLAILLPAASLIAWVARSFSAKDTNGSRRRGWWLLWGSGVCLLLFWYLYLTRGVFGTLSQSGNLARLSIERVSLQTANALFAGLLAASLVVWLRDRKHRDVPIQRWRQILGSLAYGICFLPLFAHGVLLAVNAWLPWRAG